jgi:hypothetical protein
VVLRADALAVRTAAERAARGAPALAAEIFGASKVAEALAGRARAAVPTRVGGAAGAVWKVDGVVRSAFLFETRDGSISAIEIVMEPARLRSLDV